jgi:hypothetical protein
LIVTTVFVGIIRGIPGVSGKPPRDMATVPRCGNGFPFFSLKKTEGRGAGAQGRTTVQKEARKGPGVLWIVAGLIVCEGNKFR